MAFLITKETQDYSFCNGGFCDYPAQALDGTPFNVSEC